MKIAHFSDSFLPKIDGVSFSVEGLSRQQAEENEVMLFVPAYGKKEGEERWGKVRVRRYRSVPTPIYKDFHLAFPNFLSVYGEVKDFGPDLIHVHTPATMGLMGIIAGRKLGKPVVGTYHTLVSEFLVYLVPKWSWGGEIKLAVKRVWEELMGKGMENGFVKGFVEELKSIMGAGGGQGQRETLPKRAAWFLVNKFFNYCDAVVTPSEVIRRELLKRGMKPRVVAISNGVDVRMFRAKRRYSSRYEVLHVGRMGYEKKVDVVVRAFALVVKRLPQARLTLVGEGPAMGDLMRVVADLRLRDKVRFAGWVERKRLGGVYRASNVFVTASPMETQGLVILEAMAAGVPVVGVNKYAVGDMVVNGRSGFLVREGDVRAMAGRIRRILTDTKLEERLGRAARRAAMEHDIRESAGKMKEVYDQLVKEKRTQRTGSKRDEGWPATANVKRFLR